MQLSLLNCNQFAQLFTDKLGRKLKTELLLKFLPHLKLVTTLPCEILIFKNCAD